MSFTRPRVVRRSLTEKKSVVRTTWIRRAPSRSTLRHGRAAPCQLRSGAVPDRLRAAPARLRIDSAPLRRAPECIRRPSGDLGGSAPAPDDLISCRRGSHRQYARGVCDVMPSHMTDSTARAVLKMSAYMIGLAPPVEKAMGHRSIFRVLVTRRWSKRAVATASLLRGFRFLWPRWT